MKKFTSQSIFFVVFCLVLFSSTYAEEKNEKKEGKHVVELTSKNFDDVIKENEVVVVEFFAPWCVHCQKLAPIYESAAEKLKKSGSKVVLANVDAISETDLSQKYNIQSYPTFKLFKKGIVSNFNPLRDVDGIIKTIEKFTSPAAKEVPNFDEFLKEDSYEPVFAYEFKNKDDDLYKDLENIAEEFRLTGRSVYSFKSDLTKPNFYVIREKEKIEFKDKATKDNIIKFFKEETLPLFGPITVDNYQLYVASEKSLVWVSANKKEFENLKPVFKNVSRHSPDINFVWLDTDQFQTHAENMGAKSFPSVIFERNDDENAKRKYIESDKDKLSNEKAMLQWVKDVKDGKVPYHIKSEPIPTSNDEPVKVVVASSFDSMVFHKDKDVLLEIYASWCGHCKQFEKDYKELAQTLEGNDHVIVAKLNGPENDAPNSFKVTAFPSFFFVKAGSKTPLRFEGDRSVKNLISFVKEHSSKPVKETKDSKPDKSEEL